MLHKVIFITLINDLCTSAFIAINIPILLQIENLKIYRKRSYRINFYHNHPVQSNHFIDRILSRVTLHRNINGILKILHFTLDKERYAERKIGVNLEEENSDVTEYVTRN